MICTQAALAGDPAQVHAVGVDDIVATLENLRTGKALFVQFAARLHDQR